MRDPTTARASRPGGTAIRLLVADGQEAIAQAETLQPDVVLMDLQMPRLGGVAATREITSRAPRRAWSC